MEATQDYRMKTIIIYRIHLILLEDKLGRAYSMHGRGKKYIQNFIQETSGKILPGSHRNR
jgi:hypothetical protein